MAAEAVAPDWRGTEHARARWRRRFKKLKRPELMMREVARARRLGGVGCSEYYQTPCGAVLVVEQMAVKTVLLGRQLPDNLRDMLRGHHAVGVG